MKKKVISEEQILMEYESMPDSMNIKNKMNVYFELGKSGQGISIKLDLNNTSHGLKDYFAKKEYKNITNGGFSNGI